MAATLLNDNQQRRLSTHLRLLTEDLDVLLGLPELTRPGEPNARVTALAKESRAAAEDARRVLRLPADHRPSLRRRVGAVAEVWAARMEDLEARRLAAYGPVHPQLAEILDSRLMRLRDLLASLGDAASELPEG